MYAQNYIIQSIFKFSQLGQSTEFLDFPYKSLYKKVFCNSLSPIDGQKINTSMRVTKQQNWNNIYSDDNFPWIQWVPNLKLILWFTSLQWLTLASTCLTIPKGPTWIYTFFAYLRLNPSISSFISDLS